MIEKLDLKDIEIARSVLELQITSYKIESQLF